MKIEGKSNLPSFRNWVCLLFFLLAYEGFFAQSYTTGSEDREILEEEAYRFSQMRKKLADSPEDIDLMLEYLEECANVGFLDSASAVIIRYRDEVHKLGSATQVGKFVVLEGTVLYSSNLFDSATAVLGRGLDQPELARDSLLKAELLLFRGITWRLRGDYLKSITDLHQSRSCYAFGQDSLGMMKTLVQIGMVHLLQRDFEQSEIDLKEALSYFQREGDWKNESMVWSTLSVMHQGTGKFEEGVKEGLKSLTIRYEHRQIRGQAESLNNIAINYMSLNQWEKGIEMLREATRKFQNAGDHTYAPTLMTNIGYCYYNLDSFPQALAEYRKAVKLGEERKQSNALLYGYQRMAELFEHTEQFDSAYVYLAKHDSIESQMLGQTQIRKIEELEAEYGAREHALEMEALERENDILFTRNVAIIIAGILLFIVAWGVLIFLVMRYRKNKKLFYAEKEALEAKESVARAQLALSEKELENKRGELTSFLNRILDKESVISELEGKIADLESRIESGDPQKQEVRDALAKMRILTDEDWGEFRNRFSNVYPNLIERLRESYPDLSQGEIRIFLLMKLGLEPAQMTNVLGVSKEGVKKARYRLRKRLELDKEENMLQFIRKF